ncbi:NG,NG-dimethylarginine dimethylaminohydrolase 1 [Sulfurospirillum diekertiae]|uniref:NG,NG-dimethylarginine dimethylaminohydrolase 1 n=1 Tax=Sulfurospirillum diekertiae TaxID=1854492 RepID=A0A290HAN4_9BACT|nr:arginine deiminase family protein [Sulfurospirillum diekertiae]ATB68527.1 NG,NG-dimethylarginine dimethylaminohydrolase 1 [Sulfurospirillum diekertiae]
MLLAITHLPSPKLQECELTFLESQAIDIEKARIEHKNYCAMLERCGAKVIVLNDNIACPDSVFVEDPIIVFDEVAVLTSMGVESRRAESASMEKVFSKYRKIERIELPAKIEGGDVLKIGKKIFVGESARTNKEGIQALEAIIKPFGYEVIPVKVTGCLHLKTGVTALDETTVLINSNWVDATAFDGFSKVEAPAIEPFGANVLKLGEIICMNEAFPKSIALVKSLGYKVETTNISEFVKAEAGLTCMSVPFTCKD